MPTVGFGGGDEPHSKVCVFLWDGPHSKVCVFLWDGPHGKVSSSGSLGSGSWSTQVTSSKSSSNKLLHTLFIWFHGSSTLILALITGQVQTTSSGFGYGSLRTIVQV